MRQLVVAGILMLAAPSRALADAGFEVTAVIGEQPKIYGAVRVRTPAGERSEPGRMTLQRGNVEVDARVASDGRFVVRALAAGQYRATLAGPQMTCTTVVNVPTISSLRTDIGTIVCSDPVAY